jgi:hypothetical protein
MPDRPDPDRPEPTLERTEEGEPLQAGTAGRRGPAGRASGQDGPGRPAAVDLDARERNVRSRRKQAGPGRPGRGPGQDVDRPTVPDEAELPAVPPSDPEP